MNNLFLFDLNHMHNLFFVSIRIFSRLAFFSVFSFLSFNLDTQSDQQLKKPTVNYSSHQNYMKLKSD